ncbi:septation protein A [Basilea psittacipulmonis]|uniref:Inner membrane-spanning protein YciB n=1 Tax=Basilea psittacipulmonis DSM 24701 TaxID=1072685 RepID=A0A077DDK5_9BURK|nr:septation protein A [Basilea psittacipulmonis]AIL32960.1 septation protein A [Basilea psittacipulmonis DSM 24701]
MQKIIFDFIPLLLFFIAYKFYDIYVATGVAIVASVAQILYLIIKKREIKAINYINLFVIVVFGGLTIALHDDTFIKLKPSILYGLFAIILLASKWFWNKNLITYLLKAEISLPDQVWNKLLYMWAGFLVFMSVLNIYVAFSGHFTEEQWVSFKAFGSTVLLIIFAIIQSVFLAKYIKDQDHAK